MHGSQSPIELAPYTIPQAQGPLVMPNEKVSCSSYFSGRHIAPSGELLQASAEQILIGHWNVFDQGLHEL